MEATFVGRVYFFFGGGAGALGFGKSQQQGGGARFYNGNGGNQNIPVDAGNILTIKLLMCHSECLVLQTTISF